MKRKITNNFPSGELLYANCWEDADVLIEALGPVHGKKVLSIGSAGDNCFSILSFSPDKLIVVDANPVQLHLIELKKLAFEHFQYTELLQFLGFTECEHRLKLFSRLLPHMSPKAKDYWSSNDQAISKGVIHSGKIEHYFRIYRNYILPILVRKSTIRKFFTGPGSVAERQRYQSVFERPMTQYLLKIFYSRPVISKWGRKRELFAEVKKKVSDHLIQSVGRFIGSENAYQNHYLQFLTEGQLHDRLPHYIRPENFELIKDNLQRMEIYEGYFLDAIKIFPDIHLINASDIFEYLPEHEFKQHALTIEQQCIFLERIVYWNFMVTRILSDYTSALKPDILAKELKEKDKLIFYQNLIVEKSNSNNV